MQSRCLCLTLALCTSLALGTRFAGAAPRARPILEVDADAARVVEARVAERLVALETADVEVPPPPGVAVSPPLYFRVIALPRALLRVELWELGRPYGARSVSSAGTQSLEARRIALAAAELARRLRERRVLEIAAAGRERAGQHAPEAPREGLPIYGRVAWSGGTRAATIGVGDAWLVGPHADAQLRLSSGQRLTLGGAWLAGRATTSGEPRAARWLEVSLALTTNVALAPGVDLDAGLSMAFASMRVSGASSDGKPGPIDDWSARAGALARVELRLGPHAALALGPDIGALLRPVALDGPGGVRDRLGGLWLGGALALVVDPLAR